MASSFLEPVYHPAGWLVYVILFAILILLTWVFRILFKARSWPGAIFVICFVIDRARGTFTRLIIDDNEPALVARPNNNWLHDIMVSDWFYLATSILLLASIIYLVASIALRLQNIDYVIIQKSGQDRPAVHTVTMGKSNITPIVETSSGGKDEHT